MYRQSEQNLLNSNTSSTCPGNTVNFGRLAAEICWRVWGTPLNFNGFCVLAALFFTYFSLLTYFLNYLFLWEYACSVSMPEVVRGDQTWA